jgi:predicted NodU family carbamoyl transferase
MYILGVSCDYHDSSAALLKDGQLVAAASEERFSQQVRQKVDVVGTDEVILHIDAIDGDVHIRAALAVYRGAAGGVVNSSLSLQEAQGAAIGNR